MQRLDDIAFENFSLTKMLVGAKVESFSVKTKMTEGKSARMRVSQTDYVGQTRRKLPYQLATYGIGSYLVCGINKPLP
jgi:hypothetical protein